MGFWTHFLPATLIAVAAIFANSCVVAFEPSLPAEEKLLLPEPKIKGEISLEETLVKRRSIREYSERPLSWDEIGQLLWAAQGITTEHGLRTAPSAGALYPLELYVALDEGIYHYTPATHSLQRISQRDWRKPLWDAALRQDSVAQAPAVFIITAVYARTEARYGDRAERYVKIEVGHAAQNLLLQAAAMGLGAVPIGAYYDDRVKEILQLPEDHEPLYLIPVGALQEQ